MCRRFTVHVFNKVFYKEQLKYLMFNFTESQSFIHLCINDNKNF